jgi:hypothetical protein
MATEVDWDSFGGKEAKGKIRFIQFDDGVTVEVRPIGKVVEFAKFFIKTPEGSRSVVVDVKYANEAADILSKSAGKEVKWSHRYAVNVIDRKDALVRILEGGKSIFKYFAAWAKRHNAPPGSSAGGDWEVTAAGKGLNREYTTQFVGPRPVSADEKAKIKANGDTYILADVYKTTPMNELVDRAFGKKKSEPESESSIQEAIASESGTGEKSDDINW